MSSSVSTPTPAPPSQDKNKKRLARAALTKQLDRLQQACETLETPDQWYDAVKELEGVLDEYGSVLPADTLNGLKDGLTVSDPTRTGLQKSCEVLSNRLTDAISKLPGGSLLAPIALAATVIVAVLVFFGVVFLNANSVELGIFNQNCQEIVIAGDFPGLDWFGMSLPDKPIAANSRGSARLVPLTLTIDATDPAQVKLAMGVATIPVGNSAGLAQVTLNGISLLGKLTAVNLGERPVHELVAQCN